MNPNENISPLNVPGDWYVSTNCIDCGMCPEMAPDSFARDDEQGMSYVHRQPVTPEELAAAAEVQDSCPTEAIHRGRTTQNA